MSNMSDEECHIDNEDIIDNEHHILIDHLRSALPETKRASIAVGYFFISGFSEIMDSLARIENSEDPNDMIRLLISPTTNRATAEALLASNENLDSVRKNISVKETTDEQEVGIMKDQVKKTLEYMPQTTKDQVAAKKIRELIQKKKLQVKVYTREQLHAKAYIFELDNTIAPRMAIVGSSNLSISGIKEHTELNLKTKNDANVKGLLQWFDCHWNDKSCKEFTEEIADILDRSWTGNDNTPEDVYGKASLYEHEKLIGHGVDGESNGTKELFDFQNKAVSEALTKLDNYNGVIIADVVGTGKSYIGSEILKRLKDYQHAKPLVICPPHLIEMWRNLLRDFDIYGEVESRFKIGMDDNVLRRYTHCDVILIDESHNFRHHDTNAYQALSAFMEEKTDEAKMIMLTATPISNTIHDLKNQLKLFPTEGVERIPPVGSTKLDEYFKGLESATREVSPEGVIKIQELLKHVLIRRTRTQIIKKYAKRDGNRYYMDMKEGRKYFPKRKLQNPEEYDADKVYNNAFAQIENAIESLHLARYVPGKYIKDEFLTDTRYADLVNISRPMSGIVRTSLLKRMESSLKAFDTSINNYQKGYRLFKKQLEKGRIPIGKEFKDVIYKKMDDDYDDKDYDEDIANIKSKYDIKAFDVDLWKKEIDEDLSKFAEIVGHLRGEEFTKRDDKLHKLRDLIKDKDEKILIFSESAETVKYIYDYLKDELPKDRKIEKIDSKVDQKTKTSLVERFDPKNNNAADKIPENKEIDILVSTDVLSEGVNLHAGKTVINYDFHWNPVRLIQRVGRLDRIGSEHPIIDIFNFLPTTKIDIALSLQERVSEKIRTIRRIIGSDQQILVATEDIDEKGISPIYNPDDNDDISDPEIQSGIFDIEETDSEKHADDISQDKEKKNYFDNLPFGIRAVTGSDKLIIACEAEGSILDQDGRGNLGTAFRKHYEITKNGNLNSITPSSFLKQIGNNINHTGKCDDLQYNDLVGIAWKRFVRDMKNESVRNTERKHQIFFDKKLTRIATHDRSLAERAKKLKPFVTAEKSAMLASRATLAERAKKLKPFVTSRMRHTHQPYRSLSELHRQIDKDVSMNDATIIDELEKIQKKYGHIKYTKTIKKPRILYSMMVS